MGKVLYWVGGVTNWLAYMWLVTSEAFEEIYRATIGSSFRGIVSAAEAGQHVLKVERRTLSPEYHRQGCRYTISQ